MKKNVRMLALALVVAIAMVGAGYAAWGNKITTTTTMHSGEWKIVLENDASASYWAGDVVSNFTRSGNNVLSGGTVTDDWSGALNTVYNDYNRTTDTVTPVAGSDYVYVMSPAPSIASGITPSANQGAIDATFKFYNLHPGTKAYTRFEVRNDGSIPAKIGNVTVSILPKEGTATLSQAALDVIAAMQVTPEFAIHRGTTNANDVDFNIGTVTLSGLEAALKNALINEVLNPDNTLFSYTAGPTGSDELENGGDTVLKNSFNFELPGSALEGNIGMNAEFQVKIEIDFVQYNQVISAQP